MRRIQALLASLAVVSAIRTYLDARRDEGNIRRLAERLGCSPEEARRVYVRAREVGFGAAHEEVFGRARTDEAA